MGWCFTCLLRCRTLRGEASRRARLYIKWRSRFTSQIESRAIGRFSISFNNGLCYTSPFPALSASSSSSASSNFSPSRHPSYFRSACSRFSFQERIYRASIHLALLRFLHFVSHRFEILKSDHRRDALPLFLARELEIRDSRVTFTQFSLQRRRETAALLIEIKSQLQLLAYTCEIFGRIAASNERRHT